MKRSGIDIRGRGGFLEAFGIGGRARDTEPVQTESHRRGTVAASTHGAPALESNSNVPAVSRLIALDAEAHARELLTWLQGPGGRTGSISARDLAAAHAEMCEALEIEPLGWVAVGRELRRLLSEPKRYVDNGGRRTRTYRVPPAGFELLPRAASRWATARASSGAEGAGSIGNNIAPARAA